MSSGDRNEAGAAWTFITNHAQVLLFTSAHPGARVRDIAAAVGITERRAYAILRDLEDADYIERRRVGRTVEFAIRERAPMRAKLVRHVPVRTLLRLLDPGDARAG